MAFAVAWLTALTPPTTYALSTLPLYSAENETAGLWASSTRRVAALALPARGPAARASGKFAPVAYTTPFMPRPCPVVHLAIRSLVS